MGNTAFVPGLELAGGFFREAVQPILAQHFPGLTFSAGLIGYGSEVLGFDTPMSADHHWGPRALLFLRPEDYDSRRDHIRTTLSNLLPLKYRGYPICHAYEIIANLHNSLNITASLPAKTEPFWSRPFQVIKADRFAGAIVREIADPAVKQIAEKGLIGNIDLFSDNTDLLENRKYWERLKQVYG